MNKRYKGIYEEWVSTHNANFPLQRELKEQKEFFKTKNEAIEFFEMFKDDKTIIRLRIIDLVTNKVILET